MNLRSGPLLIPVFFVILGCSGTTDTGLGVASDGPETRGGGGVVVDGSRHPMAEIDEAFEEGDYARAELGLRRILEEYSFEEQEEWKVYVFWRLGSACEYQNKLEEAERAYTQAEQAAARAGLSDCSMAVLPTLGLASVRIQQGRFEEAERDARRAVTLTENCGGEEAETTVLALSFYGQALQEQGRDDEALPVILRALEIAEAEEISGNTPFALYLYNAGTSYLRTGNLDEAEVYLDRALAMLEERDETDTLEMTDVLNGTGFVLFKRGDCEGARSVMEEAMQLRARLKPLPDLGLAKMHFDIGSVLECLGELQEAVKHMKIALDVYEGVYGPEHATVQMMREAYEDASETAAGRGSP